MAFRERLEGSPVGARLLRSRPSCPMPLLIPCAFLRSEVMEHLELFNPPSPCRDSDR